MKLSPPVFTMILCLSMIGSPLWAKVKEKPQPPKTEGECEILLTTTDDSSDTVEAAQAFHSFFEAVGKVVLERDYVLEAIQAALIAKESIGLEGPPGNAKSQVGNLTIGLIQLDEDDHLQEIVDLAVKTRAETIRTYLLNILVGKFASSTMVKEKFGQTLQEIKSKKLNDDELIQLASLQLTAKEMLDLKQKIQEAMASELKLQIDRTPYFPIQLTAETTAAELLGPIDPQRLLSQGEFRRRVEDAAANFEFGFFDEIFDIRPNGLRYLLGTLNERTVGQGRMTRKGRLMSAIAATNHYLSEVYEAAGNDGPRAVVDRFAEWLFVARELDKLSNSSKIVRGELNEFSTIPVLTTKHIRVLNGMLDQVVIPKDVSDFISVVAEDYFKKVEADEKSSQEEYFKQLKKGQVPEPSYRYTRLNSGRSLGKMGKMLKARILLRWINSGGKTPLIVDFDDAKLAMHFYTKGGPSNEILNRLENSDAPRDAAVASQIFQERRAWDESYNEVLSQLDDTILSWGSQLHSVATQSGSMEDVLKLSPEEIADLDGKQKQGVADSLEIAYRTWWTEIFKDARAERSENGEFTPAYLAGEIFEDEIVSKLAVALGSVEKAKEMILKQKTVSAVE